MRPGEDLDWLLLWQLLDAGPNMNAQVIDRFLNDDAAPVASPRVCEPGPGSLTFVQNDGSFGAVKGVLEISAQTTPTQTDLGFYSDVYPRKRGRMVAAKMAKAARGFTFFPYIGWNSGAETLPASSNNPDLSTGFYPIDDGDIFYKEGFGEIINVPGPTLYKNYLVNQFYEFALIQRSVGGLVAMRGGLDPVWTLIGVVDGNNTANMRAVLNTLDGGAAQCKYFVVGDLLDVKYQSDYGWALHHSAAPADGETATMEPDGILKFTWTPGANEVFELSVRMTDPDNRWILRCDQAGSTIKLIERNAGAETERLSAAQTWTVGTPYRIMLYMTALLFSPYVGEIWKGYYYDSTFNYSATGAKVAGFATGADFDVWPKYINIPIGAAAVRRIMTVGDSKADLDHPGWQSYLLPSLDGNWEESLRFARSGATLASLLPLQAAGIARFKVAPEYILVNIGVNELLVLPDAATWRADLGALLDELHTKWGAALVFVAKPWRVGQDANAASMAGWIDTVLSTRSAWAFVGLDEAITIKAGDNGATNTSDGIHYTDPAGNTAAAAGWKTAMGL